MSDAAAHHAALLNAEVLPSEAFCLTAVRGVTIEEALRWDRCGPTPSGADPAAERVLISRAHALAAVRAGALGDPFAAAAQALFNTCQADREHWPELRELAAR